MDSRLEKNHDTKSRARDREQETNLQAFLKREANKEIMRFSTAGSVDDGKSTLIGRLLHDSQSVYEDQLISIKGRGSAPAAIDWALLTDGLKAEREQGITIDVAYRYFATPKRKYIIADTPGHEQYTRNMATGASTANLAIVLLDARNGVLPQSKRHAFIASLLQIPHMIVAVNKMDLVDYSQDVFNEIKDAFSLFATRLRVGEIRFIPISALEGDNVVEKSEHMPWYKGESLLELLDNIHIASDYNLVDLRFPIQYVIRPNQNFRGYCGQVVSGILRKGDPVMALPSMKTSKVASISTYDGELNEAFPPLSVTVTLEDQLDISRGDMLIHLHNRPHVGRHFEAMVVWLDESPYDPARQYLLKHTTRLTRASVSQIRYKVDINTLSRENADTLCLNEIGRMVVVTHQPLFHDPYENNRGTGCFILIDSLSNRTVGAGMIIDREPAEQLPARMEIGPSQRVSHRARQAKVNMAERSRRLGQKPVTIWLTGLLSSGKTVIAYELERLIFDRGGLATVLFGGDFRRGLSRELDFSTADLAEHLRRVGETARFINNHGLIAICALVSPNAALREQVKALVGADCFVEVFVDAPLAWCEAHDETGLYAKAKAGEIGHLAGYQIPYETPVHPDIHIESDRIGTAEAGAQIMAFLERQGVFHKRIIKFDSSG